MSVEIIVPEMGESITEATILAWSFQEGDEVNADDILVELETDKVTMEVPAPASGVLKALHKQNGDTVTVREVIGIIEAGATAGKPAAEPTQESPAAAEPAQSTGDKNETLSPAVRKIVAENQLNPAQIQGTGRNQQITKGDALTHMQNQSPAPAPTMPSLPSTPAASASPAKPTPAPVAAPPAEGGERETVVPMTRLRRAIADRLVSAQHTAAILTTFNEVDMSGVMSLRSKYKEKFKEEHEVGLGFMSFFTKATISALKAFPAINAEIRGTDIVYKNYFDIGIAVGGPKGLVVPIVRNVENLTFAGVEQEIIRMATKVKEGTITLDEMQGGTFSISNGGVYGSMMSTPILNPPQSGILGLHNIVKRPVVVNDEIVIRPMMYIALSYDHRIVDGKEAVQFLVKIKEGIEDPTRLLLEV
ncbi:MAG: 2-oxoglutarate dehydrogenase complex dihydrolipoyllysine-residue succinyltransferase [Spirochaetota bacterium]